MPKIPEKSSKVRHISSGKDYLYERVSIKLHDGERDPLLTADDAKRLLGWQEETAENKFGKVYTLVDSYGKKIRCVNNPANRPFRPANANMVRQEILRKKWKLNLESMIIGKTGICISCQHRLIGLVLASQEWQLHKKKYPEWESEPTMACLIAFGCDESDDVVNTIDTGVPRSLADVIYRTGYFNKYSDGQREQISKYLEYAVKFLWERTGAVWNPFSPFRTHAESLSFIERHPRIIDCVNHIYVENGGSKKRISEYLPLGYAAGLLYVMGSYKTHTEDYQAMEKPDESVIDWSAWELATDFWVNFAGHHKQMSKLYHVLGQLSVDGAGGSRHEKVATIIKAWHCVTAKNPIVAKSIALTYVTDSDGIRKLIDIPLLGGIDNPNKPEEDIEDAQDSE
jgi:hypothetical protein